jgi:tRNA dimethylallyltransferase
MKNKFLISIVGATALGKTSLSIQLAKYFQADIISCDSRQFYKEMSIGTAVPSRNELESAKHHFIQNRSIFEDYSVGQFEKDALETLRQLYLNNNVVILVGGSGLYMNSVLYGLDEFPTVPPEIRLNLNKKLTEEGIVAMQKQLKALDPESYRTIEIDNPHRVIRALEICIGTGKTYAEFKNKPKAIRNFIPIKVGLTADRELLYDRINKRVDLMMEEGLLKDAKKLHQFKNLNALQTVGCRELFDYFDGKFSLDFAVEEIKKNTRRFAKRQVTWNKKDPNILWFEFDQEISEIIKTVESKILDSKKNHS